MLCGGFLGSLPLGLAPLHPDRPFTGHISHHSVPDDILRFLIKGGGEETGESPLLCSAGHSSHLPTPCCS